MTARLFNGTSDRANFTGIPTGFSNVTMGFAAWINQPQSASATNVIGFGSSLSVNPLISLYTVNGRVSMRVRGDTGSVVEAFFGTILVIPSNTWTLVAGFYAPGVRVASWIAGSNYATNTTSIPSTITCNRTGIGVLTQATNSLFYNGLLANVAVWDLTNWGSTAAARLAAFERAQAEMAKGRPPSFYRIGLVDQWRLRGNLSPENGRLPLTLTGTSKATQGPPVGRRYNGRSAA